MKVDHVATINDFEVKLPAKLKKALNKFFNEVDCAEGCTKIGIIMHHML
jgi:hypothetical protein